jgi:hypothetical protein
MVDFERFLASEFISAQEKVNNFNIAINAAMNDLEQRLRDFVESENSKLVKAMSEELERRDQAIERLAEWIQTLSGEGMFKLAMSVIQNFEADSDLCHKAVQIIEGVLDAALPPQADRSGEPPGEDREPESTPEGAIGGSEGDQSTYMGATIQE